eukprot:6186989-Pleurochrysis_carterae.AAC.2
MKTCRTIDTQKQGCNEKQRSFPLPPDTHFGPSVPVSRQLLFWLLCARSQAASAKAALSSAGVLIGGHTLSLSAALDKKRAET